MSGEDGNEEFYRQLQLQQQYEAERGGEGEADPFTYVDPADGAAYEWDREKKAWFPKVRPPPWPCGAAALNGAAFDASDLVLLSILVVSAAILVLLVEVEQWNGRYKGSDEK